VRLHAEVVGQCGGPLAHLPGSTAVQIEVGAVQAVQAGQQVELLPVSADEAARASGRRPEQQQLSEMTPRDAPSLD
jgi:hypothetical protein